MLTLAVLGAQFIRPTVAAAAPGPIRQPGTTSVTADALPTSQVNGVVWSQATVGNLVFAGGQFTSVRPNGAAAGTSESKRSNLMSYDIRTGVHTAFAPTFNGPIKVLRVSADQKTLYVGGSFTLVNGLKRYRFAAFTIASGALTSLAPLPNSTVNGMAVIGSTIYLGGAFNKVGSVARTNLAAVSATSGALTGWAPTVNASVLALVATPDHSRIVVAGSFTTLGTTAAVGMGAVDARTGAVRPWQINTVVKNSGSQAAILALAVDNDTVYGTGYTYGSTPGEVPGNFEGTFAANPTTGAVKWLQDCHGDTYDVLPVGNIVYSVGHAHFCKNIGGFPDTQPRTDYYHSLAVTKQVAGTVLKNSQPGSAYGNFEGKPAPSLYNWFPRVNVGTYTSLGQGAWSITGNSDYVALGGEFTQVNDQGHQGLVRMAVPAHAPNKQGPVDYDFDPKTAHTPSSPSAPPDVTPVAERGNVLTWKAGWDRDDQVLTYDVLRGTVVLGTLRATSQFWNRPTLTFTDPTGVANRTYTYRVRVRDPQGNSRTSPVASAVFPSSTAYARSVAADGATHQWRLGSATGTTTPDSKGGPSLTVGTGVTFAANGAFEADADTAVTLDGTSGAVGQTTANVLPAGDVSIETWFKSTSVSGGALAGFGSADRDRRVYLRADGRLSFGANTTGPGAAAVTTPSAYNDGRWHQVVATQSDAGLQLYVDGAQMAASTDATNRSAQTGRWAIGGPTSTSLPGAPTGTYDGVVDDVSTYPTVLSARMVRAHFTAGQPRYEIISTRGGTRTNR